MYIISKQIIREMDGKNGYYGICDMSWFKGLLGDAIDMVITLYKRIFLKNNTVSQSIVY